MVKVGQIWRCDGNIFVVTKLRTHIFDSSEWFDCIYVNGETDDWSVKYAEAYGKLIAEYPTWRAAVNSKEFKEKRK